MVFLIFFHYTHNSKQCVFQPCVSRFFPAARLQRALLGHRTHTHMLQENAFQLRMRTYDIPQKRFNSTALTVCDHDRVLTRKVHQTGPKRIKR